jgi:hypothetical protein
MLNVCSSQALARLALSGCLALVPSAMVGGATLYAQAPAAAAPARQTGTVKVIDSASITVVTAAGATVNVPLTPDVTVVRLEPGATSLAAAQPAKMADIAVGDKVIVGKAGDSTTASRVVLMKSGDIAARNAAEQADWQKRGSAGIVKSVAGSTLNISSGAKTVTVTTTPTTVFRRYAADSVKFQDAKPGTLAEIQAGDQLSVRGDKSADGSSIAAEEVVAGTFANLSGLLTAVDPAAGTVSFKDLTTKKAVTVKLTANSDIRKLPPEMAARFGGGAPGAGGARGAGGAGAAPGAGAPPAGGGQGAGGQGPGGPGAAGAGRARAGMDLSRMLARLPTETVADLKPKDAVMIVASPVGDSYTAITLLSGVEALLTAPAGAAPITLSPWNMGGGGGGEGGGGGGGGGPQ